MRCRSRSPWQLRPSYSLAVICSYSGNGIAIESVYSESWKSSRIWRSSLQLSRTFWVILSHALRGTSDRLCTDCNVNHVVFAYSRFDDLLQSIVYWLQSQMRLLPTLPRHPDPDGAAGMPRMTFQQPARVGNLCLSWMTAGQRACCVVLAG